MDFTHLGRSAAAGRNALRFEGHPPHSHDEPHLVYVVTGHGILTIGDQSVTLRAGQAAWLPPRIRHSLTLSDNGIAIGPLLEDTACPPRSRPRILGPVAALSDLVTVMLCAEPETEEQIGAFRRAYEQVLRATTHEYFPLRMPTHPAVHAIALEAPYFDGTLAELAESRYTSVRHVQRVFVEETGLTFARWRTRARLNLAIVGLRTGVGIRQAMTESGFTTRHGLLKALQRECGLSADLLSRDPAAAVATLAPTSTDSSIPHTQSSDADEPHAMAPGA